MIRPSKRRLMAVTAAVSLALAPVACGDESDGGGGSQELTLNGEKTVLTVNEDVAAVLQQKKVKVAPVEPAGADDAGIQFPITGGAVDSETLAGAIEHSGGLLFTAGGETLEITDFVADTEAGLLMATAGAAELPVMDLDLSGVKKSTQGGAIVASGITATLSGYGAEAMNAILGVNFFKEGLPLGELTVTATAAS